MKKPDETLYEQLERIFHEPNRLAIMSALCAADQGLTFGELKQQCRLTDGNLNRHLKALRDTGAIRVNKEFVDEKPRTTVLISSIGLKRFEQYLAALQRVLRVAQKAMPEPRKEPRFAVGALRAREA
jgi:DNA-binding transcriptional ArsR family regulator